MIRKSYLIRICKKWFNKNHKTYADLLLYHKGVFILLYSNGMHPYLIVYIKTSEINAVFGSNKAQISIERYGGKYLDANSFNAFKTAVNNYLTGGINF